MVLDGFNDTGLHVEIHVFFLFHIREGRLTPVVLVSCPMLCGVRCHCLCRDFYDNPVAMEDFPW